MVIKSLQEKRESLMPHLTGEAKCLSCNHSWTAVVPVGTFEGLECPKCGTMKGILKYGVVPEITWKCNCGCCLFVISGITRETLCWQCGAAQSY